MSPKFKVVIIGFGKRGTNHFKHFEKNGGFEVVGVCNRHADKLNHNLLKRVKTDTKAERLMSQVDCDVLCICTPPQARYELVKLGVDKKVKLIAIEKPIALNSQQAFKIRDLIQKRQTKTVVCHQHRYGEHYQKAKEIIKSGGIGKIRTIYASATGWAMHMMSHLIDYMCWYNSDYKADWTMAQAAGRGKLGDRHPSPDYIAGFINFSNGVRGIIECGGGSPNVPEVKKWWHKNRILVIGSKGSVEVLTGGGWRYLSDKGFFSGTGRMDYDRDMPGYIRDIALWLNDNRKSHPCNFNNAIKGFEIMMGMWRSAIDGGQISIPLTEGENEFTMMKKWLSRKKILLSSAVNAGQYRAV
jgi:predicted dehydrogenase